jgi:hypothetical protein
MADRIERTDNHFSRDFLRDSEDLVAALVRGHELDRAVPAAIDLVGKDPLVSAGRFPGDVLRALMEIPGGFWSRHVELFDRYRAALRAAAVLRRTLPLESRFEFWQPLDICMPE